MNIIIKFFESNIKDNMKVKHNKQELQEIFLNLDKRRRLFVIIHGLNEFFYIFLLFSGFFILLNNIDPSIFLPIVIFSLLILSVSYERNRRNKLFKSYIFFENKDEIAEELYQYFNEREKKRPSKDVKRILDKIIKAENRFSRFEVFYYIICFIWIFLIEFCIIISWAIYNYFLTSLINLIVTLSIYYILIIIFPIFLIFFGYLNYDFKNIEQIKELFKISFSNRINIPIEKIEDILKSNKIENFIEIIDHLNNLYNYYLGNFFDLPENNKRIYNYRKIYADILLENSYYETLIKLKSKLVDIKIQTVNNDLNKILERLQNYIEYLNLNIRMKKDTVEERLEKWKLLPTIISWLITLILNLIWIYYIFFNLNLNINKLIA